MFDTLIIFINYILITSMTYLLSFYLYIDAFCNKYQDKQLFWLVLMSNISSFSECPVQHVKLDVPYNTLVLRDI